MGTGIDKEALNKIPMGILVLDGRNLDHIVFASHMAAHIWECEDEEEFMAFCEGHLQNAIYLPDMWRVSREMKQAMKQERNDFQSTFRICTRTGILRFVHLSGRREEREGSSLFYTCVTEHNEDESDVDTLTGLFGPMQFASRMNVLCRQDVTSEEEKYAVLAFNIEKFRLINERFGMQEGDLCLKILADVLSQAFIEGIVCRTPVDSFYVLIRIDQMDHALNVFRNLLAEQMRKEWNCVVNIGGCLVPSKDWKPSVCMDHAMQACRSLSRFNGKRFAWYDKELADELTFARYIEGHLDEAIQKGWIKAYYQPVVRPVNMALCSMEALVRWDDPNYGFLTPGRFIRILEEKKQIDKLDKAMVSLVCREYEERVHQGNPVVPVSFNLSRYDFLAGDIVSYIESEVRAHHVPKDMIHVEITESMMVSEGEVIASAVRRLHEAGYQVWMDDFGSGYSSLNLLKDYDFDKIKLDMAFFSTFTQKSKHIVMSMVRMIKELHSQTLAEGVETREEFEFLKRIGCERVQGYYLGKPAPYDETLEHVRTLGVCIEPRLTRRFVDKAVKADFLQDTPLALVVMKETKLSYLYIRPDYRKILDTIHRATGSDFADVKHAEKTTLWKQVINFLKTMDKEGSEGVTYLADGYIYVRLECRVMSVLQKENCRIYATGLTLVSANETGIRHLNEAVLRNVGQLFSYAAIASVPDNTIQIIANYTGVSAEYLGVSSLAQFLQEGYRKIIHPMDQERYEHFIDRDRLNAELSGRQFVAGVFRTLSDKGDYPWILHLISRFSEFSERFLYLTIPITWNTPEVIAAMYENYSKGDALDPEESILLKSELWDSLVDFMPFRFFWKDRNHRFLGASHNFLTYYNVSLQDIVGKKAEEIDAWSLDPCLYIEDENRCMEEGEIIRNTEGTTVVNGITRHILSSKIPIFSNGRVIGLIGYFITEGDFKAVEASRQKLLTVDALTGVLNIHGFVGETYRLAQIYHHQGVDFAMASIRIQGIEEVWSSYGEKFTRGVVKEITRVIQKTLGNRGELARLSEDFFLALLSFRRRDELSALMEKVKEAVWNLHEIDNISITVQAEYQVSPFSEQGVDILSQSMMKEIRKLSVMRRG